MPSELSSVWPRRNYNSEVRIEERLNNLGSELLRIGVRSITVRFDRRAVDGRPLDQSV
jgi:hypothetical protein